MSNSIFGPLALIGPAITLATTLPALIGDVEGFAKDPEVKAALLTSPVLSRDIASISVLLRTTQQSAHAVGADKNIGSKLSEINRLVGHVNDLRKALKADTTDPALLAEVAANPVLGEKLSDLQSILTEVLSALYAF